MRPGNAMGVVGGTGGSLDGPVHGSWKQTGPLESSGRKATFIIALGADA